MKLALTIILVLGSSVAVAQDQEMKNFNKILIQEVQDDLAADNVQSFKKNNAPMRGPASVRIETIDKSNKENSKIEKKEKQIGNAKW